MNDVGYANDIVGFGNSNVGSLNYVVVFVKSDVESANCSISFGHRFYLGYLRLSQFNLYEPKSQVLLSQLCLLIGDKVDSYAFDTNKDAIACNSILLAQRKKYKKTEV